MNYTLNLDVETGMHRLSGELGIYTATEIRDQLISLAAQSPHVDIDLSGVTEIDTAGLQIMLMAKRQPDTEIRFFNHSPTVLKLIDLANLGKALGDPVFISATT